MKVNIIKTRNKSIITNHNITNIIHNIDFHNPYNFVPCLPRKDISGDLGDRNPLTFGMGHSVYQSDRWSGRISVTLTTKTPLLIPDIFDSEVSNGQEKGHKTSL